MSRSPARRRAATIRSTRLAEIEEIRACLPLRQYLELAHESIVTGKMPRYDIDPNAPHVWIRTEAKDDLSASQRLEMLDKLVSRAMPDYKTLEVEMVDKTEAGDVRTLEDLDGLDPAALRKIIDAAYSTVPSLPAPEDHPARDGGQQAGAAPVDLAIFFADGAPAPSASPVTAETGDLA